MARRLTVHHDYAAPAAQIWAMAIDFSSMREATARVALYETLPVLAPHEGQVIDTRISVLGVLPWMPWTVEVLEVDHEARRLRSFETGGPIQSWEHTVEVVEQASGARLSDHVTIEAGHLTAAVSAWARLVYASRHRMRLRMLAKT